MRGGNSTNDHGVKTEAVHGGPLQSGRRGAREGRPQRTPEAPRGSGLLSWECLGALAKTWYMPLVKQVYQGRAVGTAPMSSQRMKVAPPITTSIVEWQCQISEWMQLALAMVLASSFLVPSPAFPR